MKLPIPQDWDGTSWCQWAVCWPDSEQWTAILRGFITLPQRGWTWDEKTGVILDVQQIGREITASNLPERRCIMACSDEFAQALLDGFTLLANAQRATSQAGCCDDRTIDPAGGYQGTTPSAGGDIPIYGTVPPAELPEGETHPPEFADEAEFLAHKCSIAYAIFDGVLLTLSFLSGISLSNIAGLAGIIGAGIAGIIVFPPFAIVLMVGFVFALGGFLGMFLSLRSEILANKEDFICAMYENASVSETIGVIADLLDGLIATIGTTGTLALILKQATMLLFSSDTLNRLYDKSVDVLYPGADCSFCDCGQSFDWEDNSDDLGFSVLGESNLTVEHPTGAPSGAYQVTAHATSSPAEYYWKSPALDTPRLVVIGDRIQARATQMPPTTFYIYVYLQSAPGTPVIVDGDGVASGEVIFDFPLDAFAGETIVAMSLYSAWADPGDKVENFDYLRIECA